MPSKTRYLFDSDVLIASKNLHYQPSFAPDFWDWIAAGHKEGLFFSIDKVRKELLNGGKKDPLYIWAQSRISPSFFLESASAIAKWRSLNSWACDPNQEFMEAAKTKFLNVDSADAWLIAVASNSKDYCIITNEVSAPESKKDIKLPDAASALSVSTITLPVVLAAYARPGFVFKA